MTRKEIEVELALFGEFILKRSMVTAGKEKYYVIWLRRFLSEQERLEGNNWEERLGNFLDLLVANPRNASWQANQAEHAVRLYCVNFQSLSIAKGFSKNREQDPNSKWIEENNIIAQFVKSLRLKHYAYKTEKTYVSWCQRLFIYSAKCHDRNGKGEVEISPAIISDFLAQLAMEYRVAKSTQNQAFSAVLFLCRNILDIDLSGMEKNVRARGGKKLPLAFA